MKARKSRSRLEFGALVLFLAAGLSSAPKAAAVEVNSEEVKLILQELADIKKTQAALVEGQQRLSEEHQQLKYWIHHKG